jgi:hypothetical protein
VVITTIPRYIKTVAVPTKTAFLIGFNYTSPYNKVSG